MKHDTYRLELDLNQSISESDKSIVENLLDGGIVLKGTIKVINIKIQVQITKETFAVVIES